MRVSYERELLENQWPELVRGTSLSDPQGCCSASCIIADRMLYRRKHGPSAVGLKAR